MGVYFVAFSAAKRCILASLAELGCTSSVATTLSSLVSHQFDYISRYLFNFCVVCLVFLFLSLSLYIYIHVYIYLFFSTGDNVVISEQTLDQQSFIIRNSRSGSHGKVPIDYVKFGEYLMYVGWIVEPDW